jgi:hypothetical protein
MTRIESDEEAKALEEGNYSVLCGLAEWFVLCLWLLMHEAHMIKEWYVL